MKALVLVGGFGTRLQPLTINVPKPLVEFANKPIILHQIEALRLVGVTEVVLAVNYHSELLEKFFQDLEGTLGVKITVSLEKEPLGTAGPLALARELLVDGSGQPFFVLNADVICNYPLAELVRFHKTHNGHASIMVTKVTRPSDYGVVVYDEHSGVVDRFVEKPKSFVGDKINAGIYMLNPNVIDMIQLRPTSIEREVFPVLAEDRKLFAMVLDGFWMDLGQPKDFISGQMLYLDFLKKKKQQEQLATGEHIVGNAIVDPTAMLGSGCLIGPNVCIGPACIIEDGVQLSHCVVLKQAHVKKDACVSQSIIGWDSTVEQATKVENQVICGEHVRSIASKV